MLGLAKSQIEAAHAARINDASLGNYLTNKYSFLNYLTNKYSFLASDLSKFSHFEGSDSVEIERRFADDIDHVHHKLESDIRANQADQATDEATFNEVVLWPLVREELEQIAPPEVVIALDLKA